MNSKAAHRSLAISILLLVIASCSQGRIQPEASFSFSATVQYSILRDEANDMYRSIDVQLNRSVEESTLKSIAQEIVNREEAQYERTFIVYYLPDMEVGNGAWAFSDTSIGYTGSYFNIGPIVEKKLRGLCSDSLPEQTAGLTEAELIERLAVLQGMLAERKLRYSDDHPIVVEIQRAIIGYEELLARRREGE